MPAQKKYSWLSSFLMWSRSLHFKVSEDLRKSYSEARDQKRQLIFNWLYWVGGRTRMESFVLLPMTVLTCLLAKGSSRYLSNVLSEMVLYLLAVINFTAISLMLMVRSVLAIPFRLLFMVPEILSELVSRLLMMMVWGLSVVLNCFIVGFSCLVGVPVLIEGLFRNSDVYAQSKALLLFVFSPVVTMVSLLVEFCCLLVNMPILPRSGAFFVTMNVNYVVPQGGRCFKSEKPEHIRLGALNGIGEKCFKINSSELDVDFANYGFFVFLGSFLKGLFQPLLIAIQYIIDAFFQGYDPIADDASKEHMKAHQLLGGVPALLKEEKGYQPLFVELEKKICA